MFERLKCVTATGRALRLVGRGAGEGAKYLSKVAHIQAANQSRDKPSQNR